MHEPRDRSISLSLHKSSSGCWADWLPLAEFAYNNKVHVATCQTPFELNTRQHLCLGVEPMKTSTVEATDTFARWLDHAQEEAKAALEWAVDDMKQYYNRNHQAAPEDKVRDKAWLNLQNYSSDQGNVVRLMHIYHIRKCWVRGNRALRALIAHVVPLCN